MNCLIFNGSPRGKNSNSNAMCKWLYKEGDLVILLRADKMFDSFIKDVKTHQKLIFIYPLYVDSMPGIVKAFFETMSQHLDLVQGKDILFIVHSGFSEAIHSRVLERYHLILKDKLKLNKVYTIISPGSEGVRFMPKRFNQRRKDLLVKLTSSFRNDEELSRDLLDKCQGFEVMSKKRRRRFKFLSLLGLTNIYWNHQLKQNNAYQRRFDKPYLSENME
jgi:putative NADPH-quinone reductase